MTARSWLPTARASTPLEGEEAGEVVAVEEGEDPEVEEEPLPDVALVEEPVELEPVVEFEDPVPVGPAGVVLLPAGKGTASVVLAVAVEEVLVDVLLLLLLLRPETGSVGFVNDVARFGTAVVGLVVVMVGGSVGVVLIVDVCVIVGDVLAYCPPHRTARMTIGSHCSP